MKATVGIDIGGTFTDVLTYGENGLIFSLKLPSAPDPSRSFKSAIAVLLSLNSQSSQLLYSTTVATNALLQNKLPRIGLIVTAGFRHMLELNRAQQENDEQAHRPLVPLECIREVDERINAQGTVQTPIAAEEAQGITTWCRQQGLTTIAVSLLHSYRNPEPERRLKKLLLTEDPTLQVILSSDVLPEFREYERTVATCLTAGLHSLMGEHLSDVIQALEGQEISTPPLIMQSSGGLQSVERVSQRPLATVFSGSSAAAVGLAQLGVACGFSNVVTFDMGGTSTDITLIQEGQPLLTTHGQVGGYPIRTPMIDVTSIGAGGGSIAQVGTDKRWHVGPLSAGAEPGPVCYGKGGSEVTVTDANLLLNRLPTSLLNGEIPLSKNAAKEALGQFGQPRHKDTVETARDILQLVNYSMCGAIRRVCTQRGLDPRESVFMAVGGAGPLHAADLATLLGMTTVCIPAHPGFAAAAGLFAANMREDFAATYPDDAPSLDLVHIAQIFTDLESKAQVAFSSEEPAENVQIFRSLEFHYAEMSTNLTIDLPQETLSDEALQQALVQFHQKHERLCGFSFQGRKDVILSTLRVVVVATRPEFPFTTRADQTAPVQPVSNRSVFFFESQGFIDCPIYSRTMLGAGASLTGPAIIEQYDSTTLVPPNFHVGVDIFGNLILTRHLPTN